MSDGEDAELPGRGEPAAVVPPVVEAAPAARQEASANRMATSSATFSIQPPDPFDFGKPHEWPKWIRRFERFRQASNLTSSSQENQVNTLMYCMGDDADDVLKGLKLSAADQLDYAKVKEGFEKLFVVKKNIVYERARFNSRKQEPNESVETFVTALYGLAEHCNYGTLHDELVRDRIVVGLADLKLSERLQMKEDLTLEKAIDVARQSEEVKKQQALLRNDVGTKQMDATSVDALRQGRPQRNKSKFNQSKMYGLKSQDSQHKITKGSNCYKCGGALHAKHECPANNAECHGCGKMGHFQRVCRAGRAVHGIEEEEENFFLGAVTNDSDAWTVDIGIQEKSLTFKLDTGADVTVVSQSDFRNIFSNAEQPALQKPRKPLYGPGQVPLDVAGFARLQLTIGDKSALENVYVVKNLGRPLLGLPAIKALGLLHRVDSIDMDTLKSAYPKLCSGLGMIQQPYTIKLKPGAVPVSLKAPRRIPLPLLDKVRAELHRMEDLGVISRVEEPTDWCAGLVVVPKKDNKVRLCVDLTGLNQYVCREKYILPSVEQSLGQLAGAKVFSKLDANMGFWQIPLTEASAKYTTFITPFGRFHFNRLPFGIASATEHFQCRMAEVIEGLEGVICHVDDLLVWGQNQEQHDLRLHAVLQRLEDAGITLNTEKCDLSKGKVVFLGHVISVEGLHPDPMKTEAITEMKVPTNVSEVRSFLGMVNQLGRFIPQLSDKDKPLRDLLSKKNAWVWDVAQDMAFKELKKVLSSPPVLATYDPNRETKVSADASSYGLGGVLLQKWGDAWRPVAYASRSLTQTEQRYAQVEKEALGLTWACERFKQFLIGIQFCLETDHKPLLSLLGAQALDLLPPRIQRFRMRLMRYTYSIVYAPGKTLWTADTLSRSPVTARISSEDTEFMESTNIYVDSIMDHLPVSASYLETLKEQLKADNVCSRVMTLCAEGWPGHTKQEPVLTNYWPERATLTVNDGLLLKGMRLVIPSALRNEVLSKLHEGHLGIVKCKARARESVWWPGLSQQINDMVLRCRTCIKERRNPKEPLKPTECPQRPWQKLGADLFVLEGKTYLLVVDYFSRFLEIAALCHTRSTDVITHLKSMFARHGIPETLMSDNGPQFSGQAFSSFADSYGFKHVTSSPAFPQSNGEAERAVQTVKNLLKKAEDPYLALLAYRATPLQCGYSPAQLLMGRRLRTTLPSHPAQFDPILPDSASFSQLEKERRISTADNYNKRHRTRVLSNLSPGDKVWVTNEKVPGTVIEKHSTPRSYMVDLPQGVVRRNRQHLIPLQTPEQNAGAPAQLTTLESPAEPPPLSPAVTPPAAAAGTPSLRTRSGRTIVKPNRMDL